MLTQIYIHFGVALAGLVSFLSPCVLPLVPPYLGYLGGTTIEQMGNKEDVDAHLWRRIVLASVFFVMGFTTVFVGFGAGASVFGQWIAAHKNQLAVRRRDCDHPVRPALPGRAAHPAAVQPGALPRQRRRGEPGRRLRDGARLRFRLDAVHRTGAGDRADLGGQ